MNLVVNDHIIKLNSVYIDIISKYCFNYLFILKNCKIYGSYIVKIDKNDFIEFIKLCLNTSPIKETSINFELDIITLISKYYHSNKITRKIICIMIGRLLLYNINYKDFYYLKRLDFFFHEDLEIKYLIILVNNLSECKLDSLQKNNDKTSFKKINILDFIFDYYSDN
jgi:hypothetical protein